MSNPEGTCFNILLYIFLVKKCSLMSWEGMLWLCLDKQKEVANNSQIQSSGPLSYAHVSAKRNVCQPSGKVKGKKPPPDHCNEDDDICCIEGGYYSTYKCSPKVSKTTKAVLNLDGFEKGGDGHNPSTCDHKFHSDDTPIVSLSTGWYSGGSRCLKNITISGNGQRVEAMVVDECDSSMGCDARHNYLPPCQNNIVGASKAVWKALGLPLEEWGELDVTWSDSP